MFDLLGVPRVRTPPLFTFQLNAPCIVIEDVNLASSYPPRAVSLYLSWRPHARRYQDRFPLRGDTLRFIPNNKRHQHCYSPYLTKGYVICLLPLGTTLGGFKHRPALFPFDLQVLFTSVNRTYLSTAAPFLQTTQLI